MKEKVYSAYKLPKDHVTYNYRYFLPYAPEWGIQEHCEQRLQELLIFCRDAEINAVQFYVNTLPGTYYMPAHNAAEQKHCAQWMKEHVAPLLRKIDVSYQINFQMFLGATSYNLDMRDEYDWEFLVNEHGEQSLGCACPISPKFRERMGEMLRLWAGTGSDIIWIDDDFRLHNHGLASHRLDFYCYCERHLAEFAEYAGKTFSREDIVEQILKPGKPTEVRNQWMDFLGYSMTETASWLWQQIHSVSPQTRLALMTSLPDVHSVEGRDWKSLLTALCGKYAPITRPCSGVYMGTAVPVKNQTVTYRFIGQSIAVLEQAFGPNVVEYAPELENTRFTTWSKSIVNTRYVMVLGQLLGATQITLSLNDLDGSPINEEPTTVPLLRDTKPILEALAALRLREWKLHGVVFLSDVSSARKVQVNRNAKMIDLGPTREWEDVLLQSGIPAHYMTPAEAAESRDVVVLERYTAWFPSDDELKRIFSGAVLLDAGAAEVVQQRGFGEYLGVKIGKAQTYGIMAEYYHDNVLPGVHACRVPHRGSNWHAMELCGACLVSEFIDAKNRYHPGSAIFKNRLGGRVAVYDSIGDLAPGGIFGSHARVRWLHGILRWLSNETFCVLPQLPHHGLCIVRSSPHEQLLAFANLGTDVLTEMRFRIYRSRGVKEVQCLKSDGNWITASYSISPLVEQDVFQLTIACHLNVFDWLLARIR